MKNVRLRLKIE